MRIKQASCFHHLLLLLWITCNHFQYYYCEGCHEEERRALLHIKDSINPIRDDQLSNWVGKDCCKWERIECDNSSSRIVRLDLNNVRNWNFDELGSWYPNATLFNSFKNLRWLDLSYNGMNANGTELIDQVVCQFNLIEHLDVGKNSLKGVVPPCLGNLTSLTYLSLAYNQFQGNIPALNRLNALETLYMSHNQFQGSILHLLGENHTIMMRDTANLSNATISPPWKKLQTLYLGYNELTGDGWDLAQVVCQLNLLEILFVTSNSLEGVVPPCFANMISLRELSLSENKFTGNIPAMDKMNALRFLNLSNNIFEGDILNLFGQNHFVRDMSSPYGNMSSPLKNLEVLDLSNNTLTGDIGRDHFQVVCQLNLLELLNFASNSLKGVVPPCLGNLTSLIYLSLADNQFHGNIPSLSRLNALEILSLSYNQFQGNILHLFGENHAIRMRDASNYSNATTSPPWKKLQTLYLGYNELTGDGWDLAQVVCQLSHLELLYVASNSLEGVVPPCLGNLTSLTFLDMSYNKFQGNLPTMDKKNALEYLDLSDNRFEGDIINLFGQNHSVRDMSSPYGNMSSPLKKLQLLDLSNNTLTGDGWDHFQAICRLKSLQSLFLDHNWLKGRLHPCLGKMHSILYLDLSYNQFQGNVPPISDGFNMNKSSLVYLDLSFNRLDGDVLVRDSNMSELKYLKLQNNFFTRLTTLPRHLIMVDLRHNHLSGDIYSVLLPLPHLIALQFGGNHLEGKIPKQLCEMELLQLIDLSNNNFSGKIPSCLNNISSMRDKKRLLYETPIRIGRITRPSYTFEFYNLSADFTTKGVSYPFVGDHLAFMTGIDLSYNQLTGSIPYEIGDLRNLRALNLSNNRLVGSLPTSLKNMENIESLDLSCNKLSGALPLQLSQLDALSVFNVSFNNLSGSIPHNQRFDTYEYESFMGNVGLCGPQMKIKCSTNTTLDHNPLQPNFVDEDGATSLIENRLFFYSWVAISYALGLLFVIGLLIFSKKWRQKYFRVVDKYI